MTTTTTTTKYVVIYDDPSHKQNDTNAPRNTHTRWHRESTHSHTTFDESEIDQDLCYLFTQLYVRSERFSTFFFSLSLFFPSATEQLFFFLPKFPIGIYIFYIFFLFLLHFETSESKWKFSQRIKRYLCVVVGCEHLATLFVFYFYLTFSLHFLFEFLQHFSLSLSSRWCVCYYFTILKHEWERFRGEKKAQNK